METINRSQRLATLQDRITVWKEEEANYLKGLVPGSIISGGPSTHTLIMLLMDAVLELLHQERENLCTLCHGTGVLRVTGNSLSPVWCACSTGQQEKYSHDTAGK